MTNILNITLSDSALEKMKSISSNQILRLDIGATGCSGNSYNMSKVDAPEDSDDVIEFEDGVKLAIPKMKSWMLIGTHIDYEETDLAAEFTFQNPNEKGRCGCGESFTL